MTAKSAKKTTYNRIIDAGVTLFNDRGERYVTTNHIGAFLGISPGNLYYYFRNKEEIIAEIFHRYEAELLAYLQGIEPQIDVANTFKFILNIFDIMWRYRFLFMDANVLFEKSERLKLIQRRHYQNIIPIINDYLDTITRQGLINITPEDLEIFKVNFWLICKHWYDFDKFTHGALHENSKFRGSLQILGLVKPYLKEEDKAIFTRLYEGILLKLPAVNKRECEVNNA